jgi:hypothetical protein
MRYNGLNKVTENKFGGRLLLDRGDHLLSEALDNSITTIFEKLNF